MSEISFEEHIRKLQALDLEHTDILQSIIKAQTGEIERMKAELETRSKDPLIDNHMDYLQQQCDRWKALAGKMAEAMKAWMEYIKRPMERPDKFREEEEITGKLAYALSAYQSAINESAKGELK
jgi:hypothetical protein